MGGIKLDWHVESEQSQTRATEDPVVRKRRLQEWRQFLAILVALVIVVGGVGGAIWWRLDHVDSEIRRELLDTVETEVTALRIGDLANYMTIQRSASDAFLLEQSRTFNEYQELKQAGRIQLTGTVISATIDDQRARVVLEEILDGVPYHVVWFYWRYEDTGQSAQTGWRHVPDDLTFWGDAQEITTGAGRVTYHDLDRALAQALAEQLPDWWARGCALLSCAEAPPTPHIDIVAARPAAVEWSSSDAWTLLITSPLVERARADVALPSDLARSIVEQLAVRLVRHATGSTPVEYSDAAWWLDDYARWMAYTMLGETPPTDAGGFMESLIASYGTGAPGSVLQTLSINPTFDGVLAGLTGLTLDQISPDQLDDLAWESFFQWRLVLEPELLAAGKSDAFLALYDFDNVSAASDAMLRLESPAYAVQPVPTVLSVQITRENAQTYAWAAVSVIQNGVSVQDTTILWRWANGSWQRVN